MSTSELLDLADLWEDLDLDLNQTSGPSNLTRVEVLVCSGSGGHAALLPLLSVLYVCIFVGGVGANGLVLWSALPRPPRGTDVWVLHLAGADLLVSSTLPVWVSSLLRGGLWPFGGAICKLAHAVFSINLFSSVFLVSCMAVDRYLSVTRPAPAGGAGVRRPVLVLVWLAGLAASVPELYFLETVRSAHRDGDVCRPVFPDPDPRTWTAGVQLSFFVLGFAVPLPVLAASYLLLAGALGPAAGRGRCLVPGPAVDPGPAAGRGRRLVLAYVLVFLLCWLPFHTVLLLDSLTLLQVLPFSCRLEDFLDVSLHLTRAVSLLHCCANPVLYGVLGRTRDQRDRRDRLVKAMVFRYSTRTGLARLVDASETEYSAMDSSAPQTS